MKEVILDLFTNGTFLTILSGVLVFIVSQYFLLLVINPHKDYKQLKQKIIYNLKLYCQHYFNPYDLVNEDRNMRNISEYENASNEIRKVGSEIAGYIGTISFLRFNKIKKLNKVVDSLIGISNGFYIYPNYNPVEDTKKLEENIKKILHFK